MKEENFASRIRDLDLQSVSTTDLIEAEFKIRELLNEEKYPVETHPKALQLLFDLTRVQALESRFTEATETLKKLSAHIQNETSSSRPTLEIRYFLEQGIVYNLQRTPVQAEACFKKAWSLAVDVKDDSLSIEIAVVFVFTQPAKAQKEWLTQAIQIAAKTTNPKAKSWQPLLFVLYGWSLFELRSFTEALENFNKALGVFQSEANEKKIFSTRWAVAKTLRMLNRFEEAFDIQKALSQEVGMHGKINGYVALEMAENLQQMKNLDEAKTLFEEAYREFSQDQWFKDNRGHELSRIQHLSKAK